MNDSGCTKYERHFELLIDGQLRGELRSELLDHVVACPECRAQYEFLSSAPGDLGSLGNTLVANAPEIDVVADVLRAVRTMDSPGRGEIVPFERVAAAPARSSRAPLAWLSAVAAVVLAGVSIWLALPFMNTTGEPGGETVASPITPGINVNVPQLTPAEMPEPAPQDGGAGSEVVEIPPEVELAIAPEPPGARIGNAIDRGTVVASFKDAVALGDPDRSAAGQEQLKSLARLNLEEAEALYRQGNLSSRASAEIAASLSPTERRIALLQAVSNDPDDAYLRYRLLQDTRNDPDAQQFAKEQLAALDTLDDENALVFYTEAQMLLAQDPPDVDGALNALAVANGIDGISTYAAESAEAREAALVEGGADPLTAELLGALTAGYWEYDELTTMADDLMANADALIEQGDTERAISIYEAVREMGSQLDDNALYAQERMAGADIETAALEALDTIYRGAGADTEIERIAAASYELSVTMQELVDHFARAENFLGIPLNDDSTMGQIAQSILSFGDLFTFASGTLERVVPDTP